MQWDIERLKHGVKIKGQDISFVEFDENGRGFALHKEPKVGYCLIVDKTAVSYKWMTTNITEVMSFSEKFMQFKTKKSEYIITKIQETQRPPTFGEQLVGLSFNPSGDPKVQRVKEICAELADILDKEGRAKNLQIYPLEYAIYMHAIGEVLNAQMNVVKVLTLK